MKMKTIYTAFAGVLLGALVLFTFLKLSPDSAKSLLGIQASPEHKPIEAALDLRKGSDEQEKQQQLSAQAPSDNQDEEDFSPFAQLRRMQEQMDEDMKDALGRGAEQQEIVAKEDEKSVSYEILGVVGSSLKASVENGYLTISGETKKQTANSSFISSFHRMFPLPRNVDAGKMETISDRDKVVLRFPKKQS